ncbi:MAG: hypothetical protein Q7K26_00960 [bacterium]|nr:hypothetical protein [bacterium]
MSLETLITLGYYLSSLGFLVASIMTAIAAIKFGKSTLGSIFSYLFIGTAIFFIITIFQKLGADFFAISDESVDIWWHLMFYMAVLSYYFGFRPLVNLGNSDGQTEEAVGMEKKWGIFSLIVLALIFIIPNMAEPVVTAYETSPVGQLGLHHFIAFILSGMVGSYLLSVKKSFGQIGTAIANPMIVAIWAFGLQHFWELLAESWKIIDITSQNIEGVERIFLIIASLSIAYAALRVKSFAKK